MTAVFQETSFKSVDMPVKLFVFALTLRELLCLELSESVAKGTNLPWNNAEGMRRCAHTFSPGGMWQAVAAPVGLGSPGELHVHPPWSQHLPDVSQGGLSPNEDGCPCGTVVMNAKLQFLGCVIQLRTLGLVFPY